MFTSLSICLRHRVFSIGLTLICLSQAQSTATPGYSSGNIIVAHYSARLEAAAVLEYTPSGNLVREVQIFPPPGVMNFEPKDLVVDSEGRIHVQLGINGSNGNRTLATLNKTGAWQFHPFPNWSQQGVTYYGAMGINKDYIYAPDQTFGGDKTQGIVRYPLDDLDSPEHFPTQSFHAVKVGLNGLVYGIDRDGNAEWFHPDSMESLGKLFPGKLHHGDSVVSFAVGADGHFYTVDLGDEINHFDEDGNFIEETDTGFALGDIEISHSGDLIVGAVNRKVILTDTGLATPCDFPILELNPSRGRNFLAFAQHICVPNLITEVPAITRLAVNGSDFEISFQSQLSNRYSLQASGGDLGDWTTVQLGLPGNGEVRQFIDTGAVRGRRRYYRVVCEFVSPQ